jgi:hypothetical protein
MSGFSRDVIEHLSQTRVIASERRYPAVGDLPNRCGTRTIPFRTFRHVTAAQGLPVWGVIDPGQDRDGHFDVEALL